MNGKSPLLRLLYRLRDMRSRRLFAALRRYCRGRVLDVGGWDFHRTAIRRRVSFTRWLVLEPHGAAAPAGSDDRVRIIQGDGCRMGLADASIDTVLGIQVLEHVFDPLAMLREMTRVLKSDGHLVLLIPQTATLHMAPRHYCNFTRFWIERALAETGCEIVELAPLGGFWSTIASRLFFFPLQSLRYPGMSTAACKRNPAFFLLYPLMIAATLILIPLCMLFSLGDLSEEPNNHLVVARKRGSRDQPA